MVRRQIPKPFPLRSPVLSTGSFVLGEQVLEEQGPLCSCTAGLPGAQKEQWLWLLRITGRGWQGAHSKLDGARNPHHPQTQEQLWKLSGRPRTPSFCSPSLQSQELQVLLSTNSLLRAEKERQCIRVMFTQFFSGTEKNLGEGIFTNCWKAFLMEN